MQHNKLPDSELEIMMVIWDAGTGVTCDYIMERLDKAWVKPTVLNFLIRLSERGFVSIAKEGRHNVYTPTVRREDYLARESASFLQKLHRGSLKSFLSCLYDGSGITQCDLDELKSFIEESGHD